MSKKSKERSFRAFLSRNGFYIAVVACVLIAAVASYTAVTNIISNMRNENNIIQEPTDNTPIVVPPTEPPVVDDPPADPPEEPTNGDADFIPVYIMPVSGGRITNSFSGDELVKNQTLNDWRTHNGIDIEVAEGTAVCAIYSGEVLRAGHDALLGYFVEQELDTGYVVIYANLSADLEVKAGDRISQGDMIGSVGSSSLLENGEKPHLHLEVLSGKAYIDPLSLINSESDDEEH